MKSLTRRNVLMLGGAAVLVPFKTTEAAAVRDTETTTCVTKSRTIVLKDGLEMWINNQPYTGTTADVPFKYYITQDKKRYFCPFLWNPSNGIGGNVLKNGEPPMHKFTFEKVYDGSGTLSELKVIGVMLRISLPPDDGERGADCRIVCNGQPVTIPSGQTYYCNGLAIPCDSRDGMR